MNPLKPRSVYWNSNILTIKDPYLRTHNYGTIALPGEHDITIQEGEEFILDFEHHASNGTVAAYDLPGRVAGAGTTLTFVMKTSDGASSTLLTLDNSTNDGISMISTTRYRIRMTSAQTAAMSFKKAVYDITIKPDDTSYTSSTWNIDVAYNAGNHAKVIATGGNDFSNVGADPGNYLQFDSSDNSNDGTYQVFHLNTGETQGYFIGNVAGTDNGADSNMQVRSLMSRTEEKLIRGNVTLNRETTT